MVQLGRGRKKIIFRNMGTISKKYVTVRKSMIYSILIIALLLDSKVARAMAREKGKSQIKKSHASIIKEFTVDLLVPEIQ